MSKTRESKKLITEQISTKDAESIFAEYASAEANLQKIEGAVEMKIVEIREKYQDEIAKLKEVKAVSFERLQHFAGKNPELFDKKRSYEMVHGKIGFRLGNPALKTLKGFTWDAVVNLAKEFLPDYVRTKEEVNKEALLDDRDNPEVQTLFTKIGVKVDQADSFYVEPKRESITV